MRFRWFVGLTSVLVAAIGITVVVADRLDEVTGASGQVIEGPGDDTSATTAEVPATGTQSPDEQPDGGPAAGQVRISGTVTALHLTDAVLEPRDVPTPLTLVSERGFGNGGELTGVTVAGKESAIVWDGGRPFVLSSGPALVLDPVPVDLTTDGLRLTLGGGVHRLAPGAYRLNTPVAVGSAGVASSRDAVSFEAGDATTFEATGDTALVLGPTGPHRFQGPGRVHLEGPLTVTDSSGGERSVRAFDLEQGAYDLVLTPTVGGGWAVTGSAAPR